VRPNVILLGFMGSGKTSTGKALAARLGFRFTDTDTVVETRASMSIPDIFRGKGEAAFRAMERKVLEDFLPMDRQVLATGGGLWMQEESRERLLLSGWCVWLKVGSRQAWERVKGNLSDRPLLAAASLPLDRIGELLGERAPLYALAHHSVDTDGKTPEAVADGILEDLKEFGPFDMPALPS
jgi:shikimate kinase